MAIMIPQKPYDFTESSLEDVMFNALEALPDNYYVFHSFQIAMADTFEDGTRTIREADFIIFNPEKGVICLEAKAGQVRYEQGEWLYSGGDVMKYNGPFKQAKAYMWTLIGLLKKKRGAAIENNCKFYHAVWFPSISARELGQITLPSDAPKDIILTKEALSDPLPRIEHIYDYNLCHGRKMALTDSEVKTLITKFFCPEFKIVPTPGFEIDLKKLSFSRLLKEQTNILNFLVEQRTAIINGAAGTGKTMIALAQAQRKARQGESVLFLCYNRKLKNYLAKEYAEDNIYYYTIDGLACKLCNTSISDYKKLGEILDEMYLENTFPYKHVVIDEGQDFGKEKIEEVSIIQSLHDIIADREDETGTFYIFYDKLQLVAANDLPSYFADADCKLTLYKNCRNTENIAKTSLSTVSERKLNLMAGSPVGEPSVVHFCSKGKTVESLDKTIAELRVQKYNEIVILTTKTLEKSAIKPFLQGEPGNEMYRGKIPVATCRTFKGLEADAIILVDVDVAAFEDNGYLFYVGASRARLRLDIITDMDDEQCRYVLLNDLDFNEKIRNAKKSFTTALSAIGSVEA